MSELKWSVSEKRLSRRVFDAALQRELAEIVTEFKEKAAQVTAPEDMWPIQEYLRDKHHDIQAKYDYRYSQLLIVFGKLLREGRIQEQELRGLSEEKLSYIQRIGAL